jgi:tetratricopeptide (TPR) repeat protein
LGLGALLASGNAAAQGRFVEDVQISRTDGAATVVIRLACPMRFQADVPLEAGALLEVRVAPFETCRQLGGGTGIYSELHRPVGGQIAHLVEIEYESLGLGDSLVLLRFDRPVAYRVRQRADLRTLELTVELDAAAPVVVAAPPPVVAPPPAVALPLEGRRPLTGRVVAPGTIGDYMINLQSTREPVDPPIARSIAASGARHLYVSQTTIDGQAWYRLRLGFFDSEEQARAALAELEPTFPRAWIGRAEPEEIELAAQFTFAGSGAEALPVVAADELSEAAVDVAQGAAVTLSAQRVAELLDSARNALLDGNTAAAIDAYRQVLQAPGAHRAEARELLGLAYERAGRPALARAEYESYLREFPDAPGRAGVQQRLNGLVMAGAVPREALRSASSVEQGRWETASGFAQYYRRDINRFDEDQEEITTLSALLTDIDFSVARHGDRLDLSTRVTLSHMYDLLGEAEDGPGDQERISYAHFDVASNRQDWDLRLGRQSLHNWGVLGRFDGAHFSYGWAADRELHVVAGYPVESTRDTLETDRQFYGIAVEFDDFVGRWDLTPYVSAETIETIDSRMAVGAELRYFDDRRSFTSMLDYDTDFG